MYFQYVDEAGCPGPLQEGDSEIQPVLSLVGVTLPEKSLRYLTDEFLDLKQQFFPRHPEADMLSTGYWQR